MATGVISVPSEEKPTLTPKAIIHQRFGSKASYLVEEVREASQNGCPGLKIPSKGPCLYRCRLQLPDFSVVSEIFKKKKDAEHSASELALERLGVYTQTDNLSKDEAWKDFVARIKYLFSDQFLTDFHPLCGHFKAALQRDGDLYGSVPVPAIGMLDSKLNNRAKIFSPRAESSPFVIMLYIMAAAKELTDSVIVSSEKFSVWKKNTCLSDIFNGLAGTDQAGCLANQAIRIPCNLEEDLEQLTLNIPSGGYYLDTIAQELGLRDGNQVMMSRTIGKASTETRLYYAIPCLKLLDLSLDNIEVEKPYFLGSLNARASYILGQEIYGDAMLASIGYTWKSPSLLFNNVTLQSYYRICLSRIPCGIYKLSRNAILTAELPMFFSSKANWRGSFPREILSMFCRKHHLAEPVFHLVTSPLKSLSELLGSHKKLEVLESSDSDMEHTSADSFVVNDKDSTGLGSTFCCQIKIFSKSKDLVMECFPGKVFKRQGDAVQDASLSLILWLNDFMKNPASMLGKPFPLIGGGVIQLHSEDFLKQLSSAANSSQDERQQKEAFNPSLVIRGVDSGVCPSNGSMICVSYSVSLVNDSGFSKEVVESNEEFEFEIGTGSVFEYFESVLTQMSVGQYACFITKLSSRELVLAAAHDATETLSILYSKACHLEYSVLLLWVKEPAEEKMEQALFSPPLSKQRVEFALKRIRDSCAKGLVDFGCGSGSLLDSLLDYPTSLEIITGVDLSKKSLVRAAKTLHSKLSVGSSKSKGVKSVVLYDGSVTNFDSRLRDFDIATCLEVIEHMEEDQACIFGDIVLRLFRPKLLIVSTPNYEYNTLLRRSSRESQEDEGDETNPSQCKFRNHDHKFEWTRAQFKQWASELGRRHDFSVEFSGVGGCGEMEPGFASQIAVFRRDSSASGHDGYDGGVVEPYDIVWRWNRH